MLKRMQKLNVAKPYQLYKLQAELATQTTYAEKYATLTKMMIFKHDWTLIVSGLISNTLTLPITVKDNLINKFIDTYNETK